MLGPPQVDPTQWDPEVGTISSHDRDEFSSYVFKTLIKDEYASPLYPPKGIKSLLRDTSLVQKWSAAQYLRYSDALFSISFCSSSSTSCNACTSTSSSCVFSVFE